MKWRKFDKKVNDELVNHQSEVDLDALWGAIEPEVDAINAAKKKKRRGFFWWFFGGMLLIGMSIGGWFIYENSQPNTPNLNVENTITKQPVDVGLNKKEAANTDENATKNIGKSVEKRTIDNNSKKSNIDLPTPIDKITNAATAKKSKPSNIGKTEIAEAKMDNQTVAQDEAIKNVFAAAVKEEKGNDLNNLNLSSKENISENAENGVEKELKNQSTEARMSNKKDKNILFRLPVELVEKMDVSSVDLQRTLLTTAATKAMEQEVLAALEAEEKTNSEDNADDNTDDKKNKQSLFQAAVSLYGGAGLSNRNLAVQNDTFVSLLQLREDTERNLETVQLGLQFHLQHKTGLELTTGLNYTQINERFDYNTVVVEVDSVLGVEFRYQNVNGDTVETMGMLPRTTTTTFTNRHYNKYRLIDVPVLLGYQQQFKQLSLGVQAGVFVNLQLKTTGRMLQSETDIVDFQTAETFKSSIGLSYYFGATIDYELSEKWSVAAAPFVRYIPSNFAQAAHGVEQQYTLYGVNLGVRYRF